MQLRPYMLPNSLRVLATYVAVLAILITSLAGNIAHADNGESVSRKEDLVKKCAQDKYVQKITIRPPFEGSWKVLQGGCRRSRNQHLQSSTQIHAVDFAKIGRTGKIHRGNGTQLDEFYAYGAKVLAPAAGTVVQVVDGVKDSTVGSPNPYQATGNTVVIDHGNNEYSIIAHFKNHSIRVREGQRVRAGSILGLCGNSGNSDVPHIHYQLHSAPSLVEGRSLPVSFMAGSSRNKRVHLLRAHKGDILRGASTRK